MATINLGFAAANETTMIVLVLSFFVLAFYWEIKRLRKRLQHRQVMQDLEELKNSASPRMHMPQQVRFSGKVPSRPLVMAAIQEAKTEVMEHFVKRKFKNPKEMNEVSAS